MKATEVKNWKDLSGFVWDRVSGEDKTKISDTDYEKLDAEAAKILKDVSVDEINAKARKLMTLNVLNRKVNFAFFEKVPNIWKYYYNISIDSVAAEVGQVIMAHED